MMATVLLVIRFAISLVLYIFVGWAFYLMLQDLRSQVRRISAQQAPPLVLLFDGPQGEEIRQFAHSPVTIGRDLACDCPLVESTVSTRHAVLSYHHNQWWLEDLNSTNGTLLNGQPVLEAAVLATHDQVRCGEVDMQVIISTGDAKIQLDADRDDVD